MEATEIKLNCDDFDCRDCKLITRCMVYKMELQYLKECKAHRLKIKLMDLTNKMDKKHRDYYMNRFG